MQRLLRRPVFFCGGRSALIGRRWGEVVVFAVIALGMGDPPQRDAQ